MTTWTPMARRELENHLAGLRQSLAGSGADPEEVVDDVRRHVDEEAVAASLPVVTESDVRRFLARVAPLPEFPPGGARDDRGGSESRPMRVSSGSGFGTVLLWVFGVVLPVVALVFESLTRACAAEFFDPLPTVWHGLIVALVPLANGWALVRPGDSADRFWRWRWWLNGTAVGVAAAYAVMFLPLTPFAIVGVIFGLGFLPLAPLLGAVSAVVLRRRLALEDPGVSARWRRAWGLAAVTPLVLLGGLAVSTVATRHWAGIAAGEDPVRANTAVGWLRRWGDEEVLLRDCYGFRPGLWETFFPGRLAEEPARQLYFRVTGRPFNAVKPAASFHSRRNRGWFEEFDASGAEWDSALGSEAVAGRVRGLSLVSSRLDGFGNPDAGWSYVEWTLEFRNDHERSQREARAQLQLPPGGVVSRLTLWVQGEEREAAFGGRGQVREAYQKVAVQQRRDPVLVTTSGPDRVLMQCFPVPPRGGSMKVRVGITAPLILVGTNRAVFTWPGFLERNFALDRSLAHGVWLDLPRAPLETNGGSGLTGSPGPEGRIGWHGKWSDTALADPRHAVWLERSPAALTAWSPDHRSTEPGRVRQQLVPTESVAPPRVAVVVDASRGMEGVLGEVAAALEGAGGSEFGLFVARDGLVRRETQGRAGAVAKVVRELEADGGHDPLPALVDAWEWAAGMPGSVVLWIHGPQPVLLSPIDPLRQRYEWRGKGDGPRILVFPTRLGPNRVGEKLDGLDGVSSVPRLGSVQSDLERLLAAWRGRESGYTVVREWVSGGASGADDGPAASTHLTRLWAKSEVERLRRERRQPEAIAVAARYQLVTPVSGAVVLENQQQYVQSGLQPVDPSTVPVVPEPGPVALLGLGGGLLWWFRRHRGRPGMPSARAHRSRNSG